MAILKCKICGGDLEIIEGQTIANCEYCGTPQTVVSKVDENIENMFNRANALRLRCEFDKAEKLYERIIQEAPENDEAYWGLILSRYGIVYVDDPKTKKKLPTCNRVSYESIVADHDFKLAVKYADAIQKTFYEQQAKEFDRIQREILAISSKEEPYDIFICYKEKDEQGRRTHDSVIANDIYHMLTNEGFKVFYAAITLEDKLGQSYEPIIFAALKSAKVMLVVGTRPEFFQAVWVKNEWSRYLNLIKKGEKKTLIPAYKGMDPYDLPEEFAHLQAQDMSKLGFMSDLIRGIRKIMDISKPKPVVKEVVEIRETPGQTNVANLVRRAQIYLEDEEWDEAETYSERILDEEAENHQAYLIKLCIEFSLHKIDEIGDPTRFDTNRVLALLNSKHYQRLLKIGNKETIDNIKQLINENKYLIAKSLFESKNVENIKLSIVKFTEIIEYKDAKAYCDAAENEIKKVIYEKAKSYINYNNIENYREAAKLFNTILDYEDASILKENCERRIIELTYIEANNLMETATYEAYQAAVELYKTIVSYKEAANKIIICEEQMDFIVKQDIYDKALKFRDEKKFIESNEEFKKIIYFKDVQEQIKLNVELDEKERKRIEQERIEIRRKEQIRLAKLKRRKLIITLIILAIPVTLLAIYLINILNYSRALVNLQEGKFDQALIGFERGKGAYKEYLVELLSELQKEDYIVKDNKTLLDSDDDEIPEHIKLIFDFENKDNRTYEFYKTPPRVSTDTYLPGLDMKEEETAKNFDYYIDSFVFPTEEKVDYYAENWKVVSIDFDLTDEIITFTLKPEFEYKFVVQDGVLKEYLLKNPDAEIITNDITEIGAGAFKDSTINSIVIPNTIKKVGAGAFLNGKITDIFYKGTLEEWCSIEFEDVDSNPMVAGTHFYLVDSNGSYKELTKLVIPNSVTEIGQYQFAGFDRLTEITVPETVTNIGFGAFRNCIRLEKMTVPFVGVTTAQPKTFAYLFGTTLYNSEGLIPSTLKTLVITNTKELADNAFYQCYSLEQIVLPSGLEKIGKYCFTKTKIKTLTIPKTVKEIGYNTFEGITTLEKVYYEGSIVDWCSVTLDGKNSNPHAVCNSFYTKYEGEDKIIDKIVLPDTITTISQYAFYNFKNVTEIVIPNTVSIIGIGAFEDCINLSKLTVPFIGKTQSDANHIGYLFGETSNAAITSAVPKSLETLVITNQKQFIASTFKDSQYPKNLHISGTIENIAEDAFWKFEGLQNLYFDGTIADWCNIQLGNVNSNPMTYATNFYILKNGEYNLLTKLEIPDLVTAIPEYQFYGFNSVTEIIIADSVSFIGSNAFYGCTNVESLTTPFVGQRIDSSSTNLTYFFGMTVPVRLKTLKITKADRISLLASKCYITNLYLTKNIREIEADAFTGCESLTNVYFDGTIDDWCNIIFKNSLSNPMSRASKFFMLNGDEYQEVKSITVPNTVKALNNYQFYGFKNVTEIIVPDSVTYFGKYVFGNCRSLSELTIPFIGDNVLTNNYSFLGYLFGSTSYSQNLTFVPSSLITLKLTNQENISSNTFYECNTLVNLYLSKNIKTSGENAFKSCSSLLNVYYDGTIKDWCNIEFVNEYAHPMFYAKRFYMVNDANIYEEVKEIEIPSSVTNIGKYQFMAFRNVTSITLPNSLTSIDAYAFYCCTSLKELVIPDTVETLGKGIVAECNSLSSLTIPFVGSSKVNAYYTCFGYIFGTVDYNYNSSKVPNTLKEVVVKGGSILEKALYSCTSLTAIRLDSNVTYVGSSAFAGCLNATIYLENSEVPSVWDANWNSANLTVEYDEII